MKRSTKVISIIIVFFLIIAGVIAARTMIGMHFQKKFSKRPPPGIIVTEVINSKFSDINNYDILRTLVNFTAVSIFNNIKKYIDCNYLEKYELIISGGGIKNKILFSDLKFFFEGVNVSKLNMNGLNIDNKEAFLMCLLGYTKIMNMPNNLPSVTGASMETVCGTLYES